MLRAIARFGVLTGVSFAVNVGLTALLHEWAGLSEEFSFGVALVVVFVMNFFGCRHFVFRAAAGSARRQLVVFALSSAGFRATEYLAFLLAHTVLGIHYLWAIVGIKVVIVVAKFFYYRVVFRAGPGEAAEG